MPHNRVVTSERLHPVRVLVAGVGMVLVTLVVAAVGEYLVVPSEALVAFDRDWVERGTGVANDHAWVAEAALVWAFLSGPWFVHPLVLALALLLVVRRRVPPRALLLVPVGLIGWWLEAWCKDLVSRPRPLPADPVTTAGGWSYPSGHATNIALGAVLLVLLLSAVRAGWVRWGATVLVLLGAALTCVDRIVLGVHHVSDVAAGVVLGVVLGLLGAWGLGLTPVRRGGPAPPPTDG